MPLGFFIADSFSTAVVRLKGITNERVALAMEESKLSKKFSESIERMNPREPKQVLSATVEAQKELAGWAGIERTELATIQREEYMGRKELREGIETINRKAMKRVYRLIAGAEKEIEALEESERNLLIKITRKIRHLADLLAIIERTASDLIHAESVNEAKRLSGEIEVAKTKLKAALILMSEHIADLKAIWRIEAKEARLVAKPA